jgi:hypothetical protein
LPKFFLLSTILVTGIFSKAQTRFVIFAGPQASTVRYAVKDEKQNTDFKFGFQAGVGVKAEFDNNLYFSPAIYYSYKGYKVTLNRAAAPPDVTAIDNDVSVHTLETAFLVQYDFNKHPSHFFIKLGPSLDFQLSGREKFNLVDGSRVSRNMKFDFSDYGRYAASAILQFGFETSNKFTFYIHYAHGLSNLNNADAGPSIQNRVVGITVGKYLK